MIEYPLQRSFPPRRRDRHWVGRTRVKLAEMLDVALTEQGHRVIVTPAQFYPNQGYWRLDHRADVVPWTGQIQVEVHGEFRVHSVESWDTMSSLVRGFTWSIEGWTIELFADKPRTHPVLLRARAKQQQVPG